MQPTTSPLERFAAFARARGLVITGESLAPGVEAAQETAWHLKELADLAALEFIVILEPHPEDPEELAAWEERPHPAIGGKTPMETHVATMTLCDMLGADGYFELMNLHDSE